MSLLNKGHEQSVELKKNIVYSLGIKIVSLAVGILYTPTVLAYVDKSLLGLVMTIVSVMNWLYFSDIGLGNGLKNKFTIAWADRDTEKGKRLVSTAYFSLSAILVIVFAILFSASFFINWNKLLKVDYNPSELSNAVRLILVTFFSAFSLRLITTLIQAAQKTYLSGIIDLVTKVLKLLVVFCAIQMTTSSLIKFVAIDQTIPVLVMIGFSLVLFRTIFRDYSPSLSHFDRREA